MIKNIPMKCHQTKKVYLNIWEHNVFKQLSEFFIYWSSMQT